MTDAIRTPTCCSRACRTSRGEPHYRQVDGLRLAHVDEGDGAPVVFWHGEPTWSFLWRKVAPPVLEAGHRVILPDLPGFGRSDKPMDPDWYSYDRHVAAATRLVEDLDLRGATFVMHDWGGPIGLRVAVELADRVDRLVLMDTGVFTGEQPMSEAWHRFREFVDRVEELPVEPARAPRAARPTRRRGRRRLRRAVPERGVQGRRARVPGDPAAAARRTRAPRPAGGRSPRCARTRGRC